MKKYLKFCFFMILFGFSPIILVHILQNVGCDIGNTSEGGLIMIILLAYLTLPAAFIGWLGITFEYLYYYIKELKK